MSDPNQHLTAVSSRVYGAPSLRYGVGCFAMLVGLMMSAGAVAGEPTVTVADQEDGVREGAKDASAPNHLYLLLGASLALGLGGLGVYRLVKRRRERQYFHFEDVHYDDELLIDRLNGENALGVPRSIIRQEDPTPAPTGGIFDDFFNHPDPAVNRANLEQLAHARAHLHAAKDLEDPAQTSFSGGLKHRRALTQQALFAQHYGLERLVCSGCDRRYNMEANFCYHEGLPLMQDTSQLAQISTSFKVCKTCGWESDLGIEHPEHCPEDEDSWTEIDVADSTSILPMIPMMVCTGCGKFGAPGQTHCPSDGQLLSPLLDTRNPELPSRGFGPRRKVCSECGAAHGPFAQFCSQDGSELVALN